MLERIKTIQKSKSRSVTDFAKKIGISQPTVDRQLKGVYQISTDTLLAIANTFPDISMEWLIRGNGNMLLDDNGTTTVVNEIHRVHADGDGAIINTGKDMNVQGSSSTIDRLLDELAAQREQNAKLVELLMKK